MGAGALVLLALVLVVPRLGAAQAPAAPDAEPEPRDEAVPPAPAAESETEAEAESEAESEAERPGRQAVRVATTLLGDPEPFRQRLAAALDEHLEALGVALLDDPVVRAALRGEGSDDGLDRVRAERRRLGWGDESEDVAALRRLGTRLRVDALVVLRADIPLRIAVFDVRAGAFFEDEPELATETLGPTARFVVRAARAARRRAGRLSATEMSPTAVARAATPPSDADEALPPARRWLRKYWAYLVGGALLVGVLVIFALRAARDDVVPSPVLRFRPGPRPLEP